MSSPLAIIRVTTHIRCMATRIDMIGHKTPKQGGSVLGRSLATGRYVLKPASKVGSISVRQAEAAVARVLDGKKR